VIGRAINLPVTSSGSSTFGRESRSSPEIKSLPPEIQILKNFQEIYSVISLLLRYVSVICFRYLSFNIGRNYTDPFSPTVMRLRHLVAGKIGVTHCQAILSTQAHLTIVVSALVKFRY